MKTIYCVVRYIDRKTRQTLSAHDTAIQADNEWRKNGHHPNEMIVLQYLRDDGSVCYEETLKLAGMFWR